MFCMALDDPESSSDAVDRSESPMDAQVIAMPLTCAESPVSWSIQNFRGST